MREIVYSVAMSLDGYVAGPNGEADWIVMDPEIDFGALFARFDTVLMGRRTFEAIQAQGGGPAMPGVQSVVVSRTLSPEDHPGVTVIGGDLGPALSRLRAAPGKDIWLFGGRSLFRSLLDLGLVDRVEVGSFPSSWAAACRCWRPASAGHGCGWSAARPTRRPGRWRSSTPSG
jgi:dihydrofolate reductase